MSFDHKLRYICRRVEPDPISGIYASSLADINRELNRLGAPRDRLYSDLSFGGWIPFQFAHELCCQLGIDVAINDRVALAGPTACAASADVFGHLIDAESRGDATIINAYNAAVRILQSFTDTPKTCVVLAPHRSHHWERQDALFATYLHQGLLQTDSRLYVVAHEANTASGSPVVCMQGPVSLPIEQPVIQSPLALVPGIIDSSLAERIEPNRELRDALCLPLDTGCCLIRPECRPRARDVPRSWYDRLASSNALPDWLRAYAQTHGNNYFLDKTFLCEQAWRLFCAGGCEIAMRLMNHLVATSVGQHKASFRLLADGMLIALLQFDEIAQRTDPPLETPGQLRSDLLRMKGWALTFLGNGAAGRRYLESAHQLAGSAPKKTRDDLYFRNIYALSCIRTGDADRALRIEQEIEADLNQLAAYDGHEDWQFRYVNCMNQARLYRQANDRERCLHFYQRAFQTMAGVRTESDAIYLNVCLASAWEHQGKALDNLNHWLRAALHWLSSVLPESLAPRVAKAILGRTPQGDNEIEDVAAAFDVQLRRYIIEAGLATREALSRIQEAQGLTPVFVKSALLADGLASLAVGDDGWGVYGTAQSMAPPISGKVRSQLARLVRWLITRQLAALPDLEFVTWIVDDQFGMDVPSNRAELVHTGLRLGVRRFCFGAESWEITDAEATAALEEASMCIGPAVDQISESANGTLVRFRRYRPPLQLNILQSQLLQDVSEPVSFRSVLQRCRQARPHDDWEALVRELESLRVLRLVPAIKN